MNTAREFLPILSTALSPTCLHTRRATTPMYHLPASSALSILSTTNRPTSNRMPASIFRLTELPVEILEQVLLHLSGQDIIKIEVVWPVVVIRTIRC